MAAVGALAADGAGADAGAGAAERPWEWVPGMGQTSIAGQSYTQSGTVGLASYHFDQDCNGYIS